MLKLKIVVFSDLDFHQLDCFYQLGAIPKRWKKTVETVLIVLFVSDKHHTKLWC